MLFEDVLIGSLGNSLKIFNLTSGVSGTYTFNETNGYSDNMAITSFDYNVALGNDDRLLFTWNKIINKADKPKFSSFYAKKLFFNPDSFLYLTVLLGRS